MTDETPRTPLQEARTWANAGEARNEAKFPYLETVVAFTAAQAWAMVAIAEVLERAFPKSSQWIGPIE